MEYIIDYFVDLSTTKLPALTRLSGAHRQLCGRGQRAPGTGRPLARRVSTPGSRVRAFLGQAAHSVYVPFFSMPDFSPAIAYPKTFRSSYFPSFIDLATLTNADAR